jgi:uridine kinase
MVRSSIKKNEHQSLKPFMKYLDFIFQQKKSEQILDCAT